MVTLTAIIWSKSSHTDYTTVSKGTEQARIQDYNLAKVKKKNIISILY